MSVPSTVAEFVRVYNTHYKTDQYHHLDADLVDILTRLSSLVLSSTIQDPLRRDVMRRELLEEKEETERRRGEAGCARSGGDSVVRRLRRQQRNAEVISNDYDEVCLLREMCCSERGGAGGGLIGGEHGGSDRGGKNLRKQGHRPPLFQTLPDSSGPEPPRKPKHYASQGRRSLLALARIRPRVIRKRCLQLLQEALDTNELGYDDEEVASLLLLVSELSDVLQACMELYRKKLSSKAVVTVVQNDALADSLLAIDDSVERLLMCTSLAVQRLEYACEMKPFFVPNEVQGSFERLRKSILPFFTLRSHFLDHIIQGIIDTLECLSSSRLDSEESMASPVALSLLSQITRTMPPSDIKDMIEPFSGILNDLKEKGEWHLGRKFIKHLATAATLNADACVTVLSSPSSHIRKLALERGLLDFIDMKVNMLEDIDLDWKVRAATAVVLREIYHHASHDPLGVLCYEALRERRAVEVHPKVIEQLSAPLLTSEAPRVTFMFKYICVSLAENYSESQSRYVFLRKYLKTTDRSGNQNPVRKRKQNANNAGKTGFTGGPSAPNTDGFWNALNGLHPDVLAHLNSVSPIPLSMLPHGLEEDHRNQVKLSIEPYHSNYKLEESDDGSFIAANTHVAAPDQPVNVSQPIGAPTAAQALLQQTTIGPSVLARTHYFSTGRHDNKWNHDVLKPTKGTVNRRKLFNTSRGANTSTTNSKPNPVSNPSLVINTPETPRQPIRFPKIDAI
ncbi:hypothetical protein HDU76_011935 [Blyttiomyces sp. JEL0837]|nr:hypothetical protein HDU76_011935 [Blyttiomyces sp. JEL0837]